MKTGMLLRSLFLVLVALQLTGCSVKGNIEDIGDAIKTAIFGQQTGLVSASAQSQVVNGYNVSHSVGHLTDSVQQTANGYTVYSGIQGSTSAEVTTEQQQ